MCLAWSSISHLEFFLLFTYLVLMLTFVAVKTTACNLSSNVLRAGADSSLVCTGLCGPGSTHNSS